MLLGRSWNIEATKQVSRPQWKAMEPRNANFQRKDPSATVSVPGLDIRRPCHLFLNSKSMQNQMLCYPWPMHEIICVYAGIATYIAWDDEMTLRYLQAYLVYLYRIYMSMTTRTIQPSRYIQPAVDRRHHSLAPSRRAKIPKHALERGFDE